ncbi:MAG TPA: hypothetical protein VGH99_21710 [Pseudonocardia sp.]
MAERLFEPLGMVDTGFEVPAGKRDRFTSYYRTDPSGALRLADAPDGQRSTVPALPSGGGASPGPSTTGTPSPAWCSPRGLPMAAGCCRPSRCGGWPPTTSPGPQRAGGALFLEGRGWGWGWGWGFGGSVDLEDRDPWSVPGRYGWVGGTGTAAHITPSGDAVSILLTQVVIAGPTTTPLQRHFWRCAADY